MIIGMEFRGRVRATSSFLQAVKPLDAGLIEPLEAPAGPPPSIPLDLEAGSRWA